QQACLVTLQRAPARARRRRKSLCGNTGSATSRDPRRVGMSNSTEFLENNSSESVLAEHVAAIRKIEKRTLPDIIERGRRLTECKRIVGHGHFGAFLAREFGWTEQTAVNFMHVYELATSNNFLDFNLPVSVIYLLARPSTPVKVRDEIIERAQAGERVSVAEVKRVIEDAKSGFDKPRTKAPDDAELIAALNAAPHWSDAAWTRVLEQLPFERFMRVKPPSYGPKLARLETQYSDSQARRLTLAYDATEASTTH